MARFRSKPMEVHAEPYRPGLEDAFTCEAMPILVTPAGRLTLAHGDWIVTKPTGEREVMKAEAFQAFYERCPTDRSRDVAGRVDRGVPLRSG